MSSVEFVSFALRTEVAPPSIGMVKARIRHAARRMRWSFSRTKDAWYADPRVSISADELRAIEEETGLRYGRQEVREIEEIIAKADTLMDGPEADFYRPFVAAIRAMARVAYRAGTQGD